MNSSTTPETGQIWISPSPSTAVRHHIKLRPFAIAVCKLWNVEDCTASESKEKLLITILIILLLLVTITLCCSVSNIIKNYQVIRFPTNAQFKRYKNDPTFILSDVKVDKFKARLEVSRPEHKKTTYLSQIVVTPIRARYQFDSKKYDENGKQIPNNFPTQVSAVDAPFFSLDKNINGNVTVLVTNILGENLYSHSQNYNFNEETEDAMVFDQFYIKIDKKIIIEVTINLDLKNSFCKFHCCGWPHKNVLEINYNKKKEDNARLITYKVNNEGEFSHLVSNPFETKVAENNNVDDAMIEAGLCACYGYGISRSDILFVTLDDRTVKVVDTVMNV